MNYPKMIINFLKPELSVYAAEALEIVLNQIPNDETDTLCQVIRYAYNICFDEDELGDVLFDNDTSESFANNAYIPNVSDELENALYNMLYGIHYAVVSVVGEIHEDPKYREMAMGLEEFIDNRPTDSTNFFDFDNGDREYVIEFITDYKDVALKELDEDWVRKMKGFGNSEYYAFRLSGVYDLKADDWLKVNSIGDLHGAD